MFFDMFPNLTVNNTTTVDITRRPYIPDNVKTKTDFFYMYDVKDGEKIEDVAYDAYGDAELHWIIMLMNDIIDPFIDWAMSTSELNRYILKVYTGTGNVANAPDGTHHWVLNGVTYNYAHAGAVSVSNRQYEIDRNETKRSIKMLRKEYVDQVISEMETLLR